MAAESAVWEEPVFYPSRLWGLDFHFNTFNKLYIADILAFKPYPMYPGMLIHKNKTDYKTDFCSICCLAMIIKLTDLFRMLLSHAGLWYLHSDVGLYR